MFLGRYLKKFLRLCIILSIMLSTTVLAQGTGAIKGKVLDKATKEALAGANVILNRTNLGAATDLDGNFIIRNVPAGKQKLIISYIGYNSDSIEVNFIANRTIEEDFYLTLNVVEGQTVIVTSQAQGQMSAIQQQLTSDKISNIVSEAKIQELPDFNAAASIGRLPGVSTLQSSGEANKVVIRGLAPKYNQITIGGVSLASTGSDQIGITSLGGAYNNINNDRSVDLTMISPYMLKNITVYKALTPDLNADAIGGVVNMDLREAPSGLHTDLLWQSGYTAKTKQYGNYRANASISNRFFNDQFGVYVLGNIESYDRNSDNMNANYDIVGDKTEIDPTTGFRPVQVSSVTFNRHIETRKRYGGNLILDYALPNGSIKFVNLLAQINSNYTNHDQTINYNNGQMSWRLGLGENITDQELHSLKFKYDFGFISADLSAGYTRSTNKLDKSPVINFNQTNALTSNAPRRNLVPEDLTYLLTDFKGDSAVVLRSANLFSTDYQDDKYTYKADFQIPFNINTDASGFFKFGGQYNRQSISTNQEAPYLGFNGSVTGTGTDIQTNLMKAIYNKFGISADNQGNLTGVSFLNPDRDLFASFLDNKYGAVYYSSSPVLLTNILDYIIGNPAFDASNSQTSTGNRGGWYDGPYQQLTNDYNYHEDYYAAYAMSKINFLDFMVIGGARYEKVKSDYFAYNARDIRNPQQQKMYDTTSVSESEFVLPMAQIKYSPLDWMDVRYAYTQTLARPDYSSLSPKFTITNETPGFIFAGNPGLKPAKAFNHDLNFTFHSNQLGLFTVGGFYKTIENFVYTASYQLDAAQNAGIDNISRYTIVRDGANVVIPAVNATVIRPLNNPFDATVKGLELDFQHNFWYLPVPFNNIVLSINYARIQSSTRYPFYDVNVIVVGRDRIPLLIDSSSAGRLIDQPNHILNAAIGYDYEGFSSRLSFLFQANSATGNGGKFPENDSYTKDYFRIDFSARQKLPWLNSEVVLDVSNLNNANTSGIQKSTQGFRSIQNYGLTANLGLRVSY